MRACMNGATDTLIRWVVMVAVSDNGFSKIKQRKLLLFNLLYVQQVYSLLQLSRGLFC